MLYFFPLKYFFMRCENRANHNLICWTLLLLPPPPFLKLIINDVITWSTVYMLFYPILQHNKLTHIKLKYLLCAILSLLCSFLCAILTQNLNILAADQDM